MAFNYVIWDQLIAFLTAPAGCLRSDDPNRLPHQTAQ
jgi:hypothetical protein